MAERTSRATYESQRNVWQAMWAGLRGRCPGCHEKTLYARYLKPSAVCNSCGEELHHHRADDAPAYFAIFIIGHLIIPAVLFIEVNFGWPLWVHATLWLPMALILTLVLLPVIKGALIGLQWAYRMHGFGTADGLDLAGHPDQPDQPDHELLAIHNAKRSSQPAQ